MGINGLLQQLKSISRPTHVSSYSGQKVAIDGYSWLHKGAYSCSRELCEGLWTDGYVRYFVSRIEMLLGNGVIPVVVFDGCRLPMKADEEENRRRGRREAMERARAHAESGNMAAATECYQRAVDIAPWMAKVVIEALRERGVTCLVAPYEADAQMSYLALRGDVHAVLTEDSDLLAYGCPRVLYKLDRAGSGEEILLADLPLVRELNMVGFDHDMLLQMCILAGCDFLPNMAGVGIKKAHAMIRKHRDFNRALRTLRFNGTAPPPGYEVRFQRTIWLFRHQRIFCPASRTLTHLRPLPPGGLGAADVLYPAALPPEGPERQELPFLGPPLEHSVAAGIADGDLDPSTLQPFDLVSIYRGCAHPPRHLRAVLQLPPLCTSQQQQLSFGASGDTSRPQRRHSWSGGGSAPSHDLQDSRQQHPTPPSHAHASHHHHHHHRQHHHQHQPNNYKHDHQQRHGRQAGKPPMPPGPQSRGVSRGIERFFPSHPAVSQPFRKVVSLGAEGMSRDGAAAGAATGGLQHQLSSGALSLGAASASPVVTLSGLAVELVDGGCRSGGAAAAGSRPAGTAGGAEQGAGGDGVAASDAEEADGTPPSPKRRRLEGADAAAPAPQVSGLSTGGAGPASGSLFARYGWKAGGCLARGTEPGPGIPLSACAQATAAENEDPGAGLPGVSVDDCGGDSQSACARGLLSAQLCDLLGDCRTTASQGFGGSQQRDLQGLRKDWSSGAESDSQYDSQYDSQLTSEGDGASRSRRGQGRLSGRGRGPAQLAYEALFTDPLVSGQLSQQPSSEGGSDGGFNLCGDLRPAPGPTALASTQPMQRPPPGSAATRRLQAWGALAALQSWRQGPAPVGGSSQAAVVSMPTHHQSRASPSKLSHAEPEERDAPQLLAARASSPSAAGAMGPLAANAGASRQRAPWNPLQFSIYDLEEPDLKLDEALRQERAAGVDAGAGVAAGCGLLAPGGGHGVCAGRQLGVYGIEGSEDDEEDEVTSPLKCSAATARLRPLEPKPGQATRLPGIGLGLRRRRDPSGQLPLLLHPSARWRLSAGAAAAAADGDGCLTPRPQEPYAPRGAAAPRRQADQLLTPCDQDQDMGCDSPRETEEEGQGERVEELSPVDEGAGRVVGLLSLRRQRQRWIAVDAVATTATERATSMAMGSRGRGLCADPRVRALCAARVRTAVPLVGTVPSQRRPGRRRPDPTGAGDSEDCGSLPVASGRGRSQGWLVPWEGFPSASQGLSPNRGQGARAPGGGCPSPTEGEERGKEGSDFGLDCFGGGDDDAEEEIEQEEEGEETRQLMLALCNSEARRRDQRRCLSAGPYGGLLAPGSERAATAAGAVDEGRRAENDKGGKPQTGHFGGGWSLTADSALREPNQSRDSTIAVGGLEEGPAGKKLLECDVSGAGGEDGRPGSEEKDGGGDGAGGGGCRRSFQGVHGAAGASSGAEAAAALAGAYLLSLGQQQQQHRHHHHHHQHQQPCPEAATDDPQEQQQRQRRQRDTDADAGEAADEDDDVLITADGAPTDAGCFHSVRHAERFAQVARHAVNRMQCAVQPPAQPHRPTAPPAPPPPGPAAPSQRRQQQPLERSSQHASQPHQRASAVGAFRPPGSAAAAAGKPSLADFAFVRSAPKRRASSGRVGGGPAAAGWSTGAATAGGSRRSSVFVQLDPGSGTQDVDLGPGLPEDVGDRRTSMLPPLGPEAMSPLPRQQPSAPSRDEGARCAQAPVAEAEEGEEDDVEIVGMTEVAVAPHGVGGAGGRPLSVHRGAQRQAMADLTLRLPFRAPRAAGARSGPAPRGGPVGGTKGGAAARGKGSGKEQQPRITDSFKSFAYKAGK